MRWLRWKTKSAMKCIDRFERYWTLLLRNGWYTLSNRTRSTNFSRFEAERSRLLFTRKDTRNWSKTGGRHTSPNREMVLKTLCYPVLDAVQVMQACKSVTHSGVSKYITTVNITTHTGKKKTSTQTNLDQEMSLRREETYQCGSWFLETLQELQ